MIHLSLILHAKAKFERKMIHLSLILHAKAKFEKY